MSMVYDLRRNENDFKPSEGIKVKKSGTLFDVCKKDIGAIAFLAKCYSYPDRAFDRMLNNDIVGSDLNTLYEVCCEGNVLKALWAMSELDIDYLKTHIANKIKFD